MTTEHDLKSLKDAPVPAPRADARKRALDAANAAFAAAAESQVQATGKVLETQTHVATKENVIALRRKGGSQQRNPFMSYRPSLAASLVTVFVVAPVAYLALGPSSKKTSVTLSGVSNALEGGETYTPKAAPQRNAVVAPQHEIAQPPQQRLSGLVTQHQRSRQVTLDQGQPSSRVAFGDHVRVQPREYRDQFETFVPNPIVDTSKEPVSTFSLDVDTASYAVARRHLNAGSLPPAQSVRVEEWINYFPYAYAPPQSRDVPFAPQVTVVPSPWNPQNKLVHVGVKGYALNDEQRPRANLVLLIDTSGSMGPEDRLPLLKKAFRMLVDQLKPDDTIGIVTYASGSDVRLHPTSVSERGKILAAIDSLHAGGSTSGAQGLQDAYALAERHFDSKGVNRIIIGTDGDWNVGITNRDELKGFIERKRERGIYLSILGVGMGNYNDALMQTLARNGNGVAAYIDTLNEARKVLVEEASSSIFPIAKNVKVQVEFNPATVQSYRLIGYEKRALRNEDFNNDRVDAGDIGSGHTVTAIYEITPVGAPTTVDQRRYAPAAADAAPKAAPVASNATEYAFLKMRYVLPNETTSRLISQPISIANALTSLDQASVDVRFSIAVAAFGQKLRNSQHISAFSFDEITRLALSGRGDDPFGYRGEFVNLVRLAKTARE
jgi:Ca-activated chloride channel homolog